MTTRLGDLDVAAVRRQSRFVVWMVLAVALSAAAIIAWLIATFPDLPMRLKAGVL